jgi:hypothetical protein
VPLSQPPDADSALILVEAENAPNFSWNEIGKLRSELRWAQGELHDLRTWGERLGYAAGAGGVISRTPKMKPLLQGVIGTAGAMTVGVVSVFGSWNLNRRINLQESKIDALQERIEQLQLEQAGVCN